jgi:hypothetical protein
MVSLREYRFRLFVRQCCDLQTRVKLFGDRELFGAVLESVEESYAAYVAAAFGGPVLDFIKWCFENPEKVIALIKLIIDLIP